MDRDGKEAFDLLDELESTLDIKVRPLTWPIGMGDRFQGVYNIYQKSLNLFSANKTKISDDVVSISDINNAALNEIVGEKPAEELREEFDLMVENGGTPRDYGLKVKSHPVLMVTSPCWELRALPMLLNMQF